MAESPKDESAEDQSEATTEEPEEFLNRAARRAKGKTHGKAETAGSGMQPHGRGSVQVQRSYGNRRSG
jgi:hypothetical protein